MENGSANFEPKSQHEILNTQHPTVQSFFKSREALISQENSHRSDHEFRQSLSPITTEACKIISRIREEEQQNIWSTKKDSSLEKNELFPGMMFNVAKSHIESTKLFRIISKMPKGSLLHGHLGAMVDLEWVFNEAIETVGMCFSADVGLVSEVREGAGVKFAFSRSVKEGSGASIWGSDYEAGRRAPLKEAAETFPDGGRDGFVAWMKDRCSITQTESLQHHLGVDDVWRKLQGAFIIVTPIIYYEPIMRSFLRKFFTTLVEDGVRWVEIRTVLSTPFTLEGADGPTGSPIDLVRVLHEEVENFREGSGGKFWGARLIWTGMRFQSTEFLVKDMDNCILAKTLYPKLVSGYDLVGQEDLGRTLHSLTPEILYFKEQCASQGVNIPFFFHAGECLGSGSPTDHNLFDAILFGTRRLGHAFSLHKHPTLIDMVKEKQILVESCPISNEVLRYTASILSHPLPALINRGVRAALSNDDPALLGQGTSGLTYDFWQVLQGWEDLGLAGLGSLAQNSVRWSAFEDQEDDEWLRDVEKGENGTGTRARRIQEWNGEWKSFCGWVVREFGRED